MVKFDLFPQGIDYYKLIALDIRGQKHPLLLMRILALTIQTALLILAIARNQPSHLLLMFTGWGIMISWVAMLFTTIASLIPNEDGKPRMIYKVAYGLFETAWTAQLVITVFFWVVLTPLSHTWMHLENYRVLMTTENHALAMCNLVADTLINNVQFRIPHLLFPLIVAFCYMAVGIVASYTADFVAYSILTWKDAMSVPIVLALVALFVGCFFAGQVIGKYKRRLLLSATARENDYFSIQ